MFPQFIARAIKVTKKLIILGTGGDCVDILDTLRDINDARRAAVYECLGFLDDNADKWGQMILGAPVLGSLDAAARYADCVFAFGIGSEFNFWQRHEILARTKIPLESFETIIHPTASISRTAQIGKGAVIFQHATVTTNVRLGDFVKVLPNTVLSHDVVVGAYTCVAGGVSVSGEAQVGASCYLGANCCIKSRVKIGDECLVGMGSVVLRDVEANTVVVGNPARVLRATK